MPQRTIVIGDIHGHSAALAAIVDLIRPQQDDTLVFLGDYVDRGPDSKGVLEQVIRLSERFHVVALMGNHEEMMLGAREGRDNLRFWLTPTCGGLATLTSYGKAEDISLIPREHFQFLASLPLFYETDTHFFFHANYAPNWRLDQHDTKTALWRPLSDLPGPHYSGKIAIVGHTPQPDHTILDFGYLKCIDTGCGYGGLLTALDVGSGEIWQVDEKGQRV
jgi:serine/threonine protein phosphatase 1